MRVRVHDIARIGDLLAIPFFIIAFLRYSVIIGKNKKVVDYVILTFFVVAALADVLFTTLDQNLDPNLIRPNEIRAAIFTVFIFCLYVGLSSKPNMMSFLFVLIFSGMVFRIVS